MKKIYKVEWCCAWGIPHSDIVKAKDPAQAWSKIKFKHPFNTINGHDIRISEIN